MKLEWPMFTSTSPRELFRPMIIFFCRTMYSNSRPSILAIAVALLSGFHCTLLGLAGALFNAKSAQASLSGVRTPDITHTKMATLQRMFTHNSTWARHSQSQCFYRAAIFFVFIFKIISLFINRILSENPSSVSLVSN